MSKSFLALAFALGAFPMAALAQDTNAPPASSDAQRQAMYQTMQRFAQQEGRLHDQLRWQILSTLTPVQRRAVAATIGQLAVSPNPDADAAAARLDAMLGPGQRQRVLAAHSAFATQSRALHEQMRSAMESQMPADHPPMSDRGMMNGEAHHQVDAGHILLWVLPPHAPEMMGAMAHGMMMHPQGGPPPQ